MRSNTLHMLQRSCGRARPVRAAAPLRAPARRARVAPDSRACSSAGGSSAAGGDSSTASSSAAAHAATVVTRRQLAGLLAAAGAASTWPAAADAAPPPQQQQQWFAAAPRVGATAGSAASAGGSGAIPAAPDASCARFDPQTASAFTRAVSDALGDLGIGPEERLQKERFKLFNQEYGYYFEANKGKLPRVPDLTDESGGLSNRVYFNFVSYIGWKVAARFAPDAAARTALTARAGELLLPALAPGEADALRAAAKRGPGGVAAEADVVASLCRLLQRMRSSGYVCGWQLVWGELPGGWPPDWYAKEPGLILSPTSDVAVAFDYAAGEVVTPGASSGGGGGGGGSTAAGPVPFQIKLLQPADIQASVALRSEDDGFWGRHASACVAALLAAGGWRSEASEYFYQDDWSGPRDAGSKLLLLLGDPLQAVDIPWTPTTLVGDYSAAPAGV